MRDPKNLYVLRGAVAEPRSAAALDTKREPPVFYLQNPREQSAKRYNIIFGMLRRVACVPPLPSLDLRFT